MSKNSNYRSTNRSKHYLKCHLIFVCKYRKKLLVGQLKDDMKKLLLNIANKSDFEIEVFESDIDHIHFLIRYIPRLSITSIVRKLKQESTYRIYGVQFIEIIYVLNFGLKKLSGEMVILFVQLENPIQIPLNNISLHKVRIVFCQIHHRNFCVFFDSSYKNMKNHTTA